MQPYYDNEKRNLSPEHAELKYEGERKADGVSIKEIIYNDKQYEEKDVEDFSECLPFRDETTVSWVMVNGLHDVPVIEGIGKSLGIHPLLVEDILQVKHLPKIEYYDTYIFLVVKIINFDKKAEKVVIDHVCHIFGENFLVSFAEQPSPIFDELKEKLKNKKTRATRLAADYLNYSIIDAIVDKYIDVLQQTREDIEDIEECLLANPDETILRRIQRLKRDLLVMRKYVVPLKEVIRNIEIDDSSITKDTTDPYLKDIYDHILDAVDSIEIQSERLAEMTTLYLTMASNKLNEVIKVLTIISTIFMPLTFITSIYGMNFKYMPELNYPWAYPAVLIFMFALGIGMVIYFKKKKWF